MIYHHEKQPIHDPIRGTVRAVGVIVAKVDINVGGIHYTLEKTVAQVGGSGHGGSKTVGAIPAIGSGGY